MNGSYCRTSSAAAASSPARMRVTKSANGGNSGTSRSRRRSVILALFTPDIVAVSFFIGFLCIPRFGGDWGAKAKPDHSNRTEKETYDETPHQQTVRQACRHQAHAETGFGNARRPLAPRCFADSYFHGRG